MKKILSVLLTVFVAFGVIGCADNESDDSATSISISGDSTVAVGDEITLVANVQPASCSDVVTWTVSNSKASIIGSNRTAIITGEADGTVSVIATVGNVSATKKITVGNGSSTGGSGSASGVDFNDYTNTTYSVKVKNNTAKRLVAFKGTPSEQTLIGGIPANAGNHALPLSSTLFNTSQDFMLFIITEDEYTANKNNLAAVENYPFARFYAFFNKNSANNYVYEVSSCMGGDGEILIQNNTDYNIELRKDGIHGQTIGYTGARTLNTVFKVDVGDYYVFPVFRKFDTTLNEIVTVYPKDSDGDPLFRNHQISSSDPLNIDATIFSSGVKFTSGYAYVTISNQTSDGINFYDGANATAMTTSTGGTIVNSGKSLTFAVPMEKVSSNQATGEFQWADYKEYAQYRVGSPMGYNYSVYLSGSELTNFRYEAGKCYTFTVNGTNYKNLTVSLTDTTEIKF